MIKYSKTEIERRWRIDLDLARQLVVGLPFREIEDLYVEQGRLRVRKVSGPEGTVWKLGKKYGDRNAFSESTTNLYLDEPEFQMLNALPGHRTAKRRYRFRDGSIDIYSRPRVEFAIYEVEFQTTEEAESYRISQDLMGHLLEDNVPTGFEISESVTE